MQCFLLFWTPIYLNVFIQWLIVMKNQIILLIYEQNTFQKIPILPIWLLIAQSMCMYEHCAWPSPWISWHLSLVFLVLWSLPTKLTIVVSRKMSTSCCEKIWKANVLSCQNIICILKKLFSKQKALIENNSQLVGKF